MYTVPPADGLTGNIFYWKTEDGCVEITLYVQKSDDFMDWETIATMPAGHRPMGQKTFLAGSGNDKCCIVAIDNDGKVSLRNVSEGLSKIYCQLTYLDNQ